MTQLIGFNFTSTAICEVWLRAMVKLHGRMWFIQDLFTDNDQSAYQKQWVAMGFPGWVRIAGPKLYKDELLIDSKY